MRMWMIEPKQLCAKHLLGEHFEIHKAVGNLRNSGKWTNALTEKGFLEPQNFKSRHDSLSQEMIARGFTHNSPLKTNDINTQNGFVDINRSIQDLQERCESCKNRLENI